MTAKKVNRGGQGRSRRGQGEAGDMTPSQGSGNTSYAASEAGGSRPPSPRAPLGEGRPQSTAAAPAEEEGRPGPMRLFMTATAAAAVAVKREQLPTSPSHKGAAVETGHCSGDGDNDDNAAVHGGGGNCGYHYDASSSTMRVKEEPLTSPTAAISVPDNLFMSSAAAVEGAPEGEHDTDSGVSSTSGQHSLPLVSSVIRGHVGSSANRERCDEELRLLRQVSGQGQQQKEREEEGVREGEAPDTAPTPEAQRTASALPQHQPPAVSDPPSPPSPAMMAQMLSAMAQLTATVGDLSRELAEQRLAQQRPIAQSTQQNSSGLRSPNSTCDNHHDRGVVKVEGEGRGDATPPQQRRGVGDTIEAMIARRRGGHHGSPGGSQQQTPTVAAATTSTAAALLRSDEPLLSVLAEEMHRRVGKARHAMGLAIRKGVGGRAIAAMLKRQVSTSTTTAEGWAKTIGDGLCSGNGTHAAGSSSCCASSLPIPILLDAELALVLPLLTMNWRSLYKQSRCDWGSMAMVDDDGDAGGDEDRDDCRGDRFLSAVGRWGGPDVLATILAELERRLDLFEQLMHSSYSSSSAPHAARRDARQATTTSASTPFADAATATGASGGKSFFAGPPASASSSSAAAAEGSSDFPSPRPHCVSHYVATEVVTPIRLHLERIVRQQCAAASASSSSPSCSSSVYQRDLTWLEVNARIISAFVLVKMMYCCSSASSTTSPSSFSTPQLSANAARPQQQHQGLPIDPALLVDGLMSIVAHDTCAVVAVSTTPLQQPSPPLDPTGVVGSAPMQSSGDGLRSAPPHPASPLLAFYASRQHAAPPTPPHLSSSLDSGKGALFAVPADSSQPPLPLPAATTAVAAAFACPWEAFEEGCFAYAYAKLSEGAVGLMAAAATKAPESEGAPVKHTKACGDAKGAVGQQPTQPAAPPQPAASQQHKSTASTTATAPPALKATGTTSSAATINTVAACAGAQQPPSPTTAPSSSKPLPPSSQSAAPTPNGAGAASVSATSTAKPAGWAPSALAVAAPAPTAAPTSAPAVPLPPRKDATIAHIRGAGGAGKLTSTHAHTAGASAGSSRSDSAHIRGGGGGGSDTTHGNGNGQQRGQNATPPPPSTAAAAAARAALKPQAVRAGAHSHMAIHTAAAAAKQPSAPPTAAAQGSGIGAKSQRQPASSSATPTPQLSTPNESVSQIFFSSSSSSSGDSSDGDYRRRKRRRRGRERGPSPPAASSRRSDRGSSAQQAAPHTPSVSNRAFGGRNTLYDSGPASSPAAAQYNPNLARLLHPSAADTTQQNASSYRNVPKR